MTALSSTEIRRALAQLQPMPHAETLLTDILVVAQTGSTNADLLAQTETLAGPIMLLAERQLSGRGRGGRPWHSQPENSLTFSLAWKFSLPLHALLGLPLAVGVALAEALADLGVQVQLKWPNDVLKDGKKLAGILIETVSAHPDAFDPYNNANWAVIGVGMNLRVPPALEEKIGKAVADAPWLAQLERNTLAAHLLDSLVRSMSQFARHGLPAFSARWNQLHAHAGQEVVILDQGQILHQGRALSVDAQGRLLLDTAQGQVALLAGDVSLRSQQQFDAGDLP